MPFSGQYHGSVSLHILIQLLFEAGEDVLCCSDNPK
jgi:hypothetical protein